MDFLHYDIFGDPGTTASAASVIAAHLTNARVGGTLSVSAGSFVQALQVGGVLSVSARATFAAVNVGDVLSVSAGMAVVAGNLSVTSGALFAVVSGTELSVSGTSADFTNIPSWVKKLTLQFVGVSTNGTSAPLIQIGDSGGIEATGYLGASCMIEGGATPTAAVFTAGAGIQSVLAANVLNGSVTIELEDASDFTWTISGAVGFSNAARVAITGSSKALSAALDRVRLTTVNGTDAFDAGSVNLLME